MKILMVCLGNICRSPVAEGLLRKKLKEKGLSDSITVDSCGTNGLHDGEAPDRRSQANAMSNGLDISRQRSRQMRPEDFEEANRIIVMDASNYENVKGFCRSPSDMDKVELLRDLVTPGERMAVPDPYFGGERGFQEVYEIIDEALDTLVHQLKR